MICQGKKRIDCKNWTKFERSPKLLQKRKDPLSKNMEMWGVKGVFRASHPQQPSIWNTPPLSLLRVRLIDALVNYCWYTRMCITLGYMRMSRKVATYEIFFLLLPITVG